MFLKKSKNKDLPPLTKESMLMYRRVWCDYVADKWRWLVVAVVLMLIAASFDALLVRQLKPVFDEVFIDKNRASLTMATSDVKRVMISPVVCSSKNALSMRTRRLKISLCISAMTRMDSFVITTDCE